jgi:RES domain-containing protein
VAVITRFEDTATYRLINSRFPTVGPFDMVADVDAVASLLELESFTNDRLNDVLGRLGRVPREDIIIGVPTATLAMGAFLHGHAGRFNGPELGAWYAALSVKTAIEETLFHHTRRLSLSATGFPNSMEMRELISRPTADLTDIRDVDAPHLYHRNDYTRSQRFGADTRDRRNDGIIYRSVRHNGGICLVLFKPRLIVPITQGDHYQYDWSKDGQPSVHRLQAA